MPCKILTAAGCAILFSTSAVAAAPPADTMPAALAREVIDKTVELVESRGLYPRAQAEYAQAKAELLALLASPNADIDRQDVFRRVRKLLLTLDVDRHSFLITTGPQPQQQQQGRARPPGPVPPPTFQLIATGQGTVLRWAPPAITVSGTAGYADYLKRFYDEAARLDPAGACALLVDLSEQTGGNAWPPFIVMHPLFGAANNANWVNRDGKRIPLVDRSRLEAMNGQYADGRANPLTAFAGGPLAVLVGERTSSAGEMLLVALLGEERVRTFGRTSQGMSTANVTHRLPDGSSLVLTEMRYALGAGPVYRGGIAPMQAPGAGESWEASIKNAAQWAAANSKQCKPAQVAAGPG